MILSPKSIRELKEILVKDYGQHISDDEAQQLGTSLLRIYRLASRALARMERENGADIDQQEKGRTVSILS